VILINNDCARPEPKCVRCKLLVQNFKKTDEWCDKPGLHGDPCGGRDRESRVGRSYSPGNTCCIHSCENQRVTCIEQRSSLWAVASTMVATYCPHHQGLQHPIQNNQNQKLYFNPPSNKNKRKYHRIPMPLHPPKTKK